MSDLCTWTETVPPEPSLSLPRPLFPTPLKCPRLGPWASVAQSREADLRHFISDCLSPAITLWAWVSRAGHQEGPDLGVLRIEKDLEKSLRRGSAEGWGEGWGGGGEGRHTEDWDPRGPGVGEEGTPRGHQPKNQILTKNDSNK